MPYDTIPAKATLKPEKFTARVSDEALNDFKQVLKVSKIGPKTYENLREDRFFGITRQWLADSKAYWETKYDWRKTEDRLNSLPNFHVQIEEIDMHFLALFSKKQDAVPLVLLHGWPGSILEFVSTVEILKGKYSEDELPYHVIVPSLPGYGYSSGPPLDKDYTTEDIARNVDSLMRGLGFEDGYVSQGGDIGSFVTRVLAVDYPSCKAAHVNLAIGLQQPDDVPYESLTEQEQYGVRRYQDFGNLGNAYAREHGTRPATVGLVLSSSPIALLAWIGEKFQQWSDTDPPLDEILDSVTLYWFTDSFPRAIYPYRQFFGPKPTFFHNDPRLFIKKPMGYSYFPEELAPIPKAWMEKSGNLVWYRQHTEGGHFAALERPKLFTQDMEDFIKEVWKK